MRRPFHAATLALLLVAAGLGAAPPQLEIPAEVKPVGGYARVTPKTDAESVVYVALDGLDPFPSEELKDPRRFLLPVAGVKAGRYRFAAVAAGKTGEQARVDFVVVVPDGPPGPNPPDPPKPPLSPLAKTLADALAAENAADKRERAAALAKVMADAVLLATAGDYATTADLAAEVTRQRVAAVGDALPAVRKAVGAHLNATLGTAPLALDAANRTKVANAYADVAAALREALK